jgi:hypothetical protein
MADPSTASHHRFEEDLREIREDRGVSLSQVQQDTRIPVDVLERFEVGRLTGDPHFNEVYLKALLRAYADAVGVPPAEVVKAYQAQNLPGAEAPPPPPPPPPADPPAGEEAAPGEPAAPAGAAAPAVAALRHAPKKEPAPPPPKTEHKARVQNRQSVTSSTSSIDSSWGMIIGATLVGVLLIGGVLWLLLRSDDPQPVEREQTAVVEPGAGEQETDVAPAPQEPATQGPQLATPIQVTLIAEDGPLQNFRVTEEPDARRPYWIEQGERQTFSSETEVIIWGTGTEGSFGIPSQARLEMQGFTWNPPDGAVVRIDRQRGQALLDSLHRAQGGAAP